MLEIILILQYKLWGSEKNNKIKKSLKTVCKIEVYHKNGDVF